MTMGVITTFDEKRTEAKQSLTKAIECLQECVKEDTWGYSDMKDSYIDDLVMILAELIKLKRKI